MNLTDWIRTHEVLLAWLGGIGLLLFVGSLLVTPIIITLMPKDYFIRLRSQPPLQHSPFRHLLHGLKNLLGAILLLAGLAMLLLPGQGLLTIAIGISLIDFPGKHQLQIRLIRIKTVRRSIGWIRIKAGQPPLEIPTGN